MRNLCFSFYRKVDVHRRRTGFRTRYLVFVWYHKSTLEIWIGSYLFHATRVLGKWQRDS